MSYFIDNFKRNPKAIAAKMKTVGDSEIALAPLKMYIPKRFSERGLAHIGTKVQTVMYFILVDEQKNSTIARNPITCFTEPSEVNDVEHDGVQYLEFGYQKGDKVIASNTMARNDDLIFPIQDEFISKGRMPQYFNMEDAGLIYENCPYFAGVKLGSNPQVAEMIISSIIRQKDNLLNYRSNNVKTRADITKDLAFIGFKNISLMATGTATKMIGSYMNSGLDSALVNKSENLEPIEEILRS